MERIVAKSKLTFSESDGLAHRLRKVIPRGFVEKKMFGGYGFMQGGNMVIGTTAGGALLVRIDPDKQAEVLKRKGAFEMHMGARPMTGFIGVDPDELPDDDALSDWIAYALKYAKTLPPK